MRKPFAAITIPTFAMLAIALAAATGLDLGTALKLAYERNADLVTSQANLTNARSDLQAKEADPSTLIVTLSQARNTAALETVKFASKKLEVFSNVLTAYVNLFEGQEQLKVLTAQVNLNSRNLDVAKAKLAARNGTALDVSKAETTLATSRQTLADAQAQLPILSNRLEAATGARGDLAATTALSFKEVKLDSAALEQGLETRIPSVVQAAQSVDLAELNVQLADNDYTPPVTLRDAKTELDNAQRALDTARSNALTTLRDAVRSAANSLEQVRIAGQDLNNARTTLSQDQARYKSGTIALVQVQQSELSVLQAQLSQVKAVDAYWRALASVSTASGVDVTGTALGS